MLTGSAVFNALSQSAGSAERDVVLVSPFIKRDTLCSLITLIPAGVPVQIVTRWRADEVLSGASDVDAFECVRIRSAQGSGPIDFRLLNSVHAKYYRFDSQVFIGSANLTNTGTGRRGESVELLQSVARTLESDALEQQILANSTLVDPRTLALYMDIQSAREDWVDERDSHHHAGGASPLFYFHLRNPEELWDHYSQSASSSTDASQAAMTDLSNLGIPSHLDRDAFEAVVRAAVSDSVLVQRLREFAGAPKRFGQVKAWVGGHSPATGDLVRITQTLYRWVTYWLPRDFAVLQPNYTEMLVYTAEGSDLSVSSALISQEWRPASGDNFMTTSERGEHR